MRVAAAREGTVYIAWLPETGFYTSYWDALRDGDPARLEQGPDTDDEVAVIAWARERADRVLIRLRTNPDRYYWVTAAGELRPADRP